MLALILQVLLVLLPILYYLYSAYQGVQVENERRRRDEEERKKRRMQKILEREKKDHRDRESLRKAELATSQEAPTSEEKVHDHDETHLEDKESQLQQQVDIDVPAGVRKTVIVPDRSFTTGSEASGGAGVSLAPTVEDGKDVQISGVLDAKEEEPGGKETGKQETAELVSFSRAEGDDVLAAAESRAVTFRSTAEAGTTVPGSSDQTARAEKVSFQKEQTTDLISFMTEQEQVENNTTKGSKKEEEKKKTGSYDFIWEPKAEEEEEEGENTVQLLSYRQSDEPMKAREELPLLDNEAEDLEAATAKRKTGSYDLTWAAQSEEESGDTIELVSFKPIAESSSSTSSGGVEPVDLIEWGVSGGRGASGSYDLVGPENEGKVELLSFKEPEGISPIRIEVVQPDRKDEDPVELITFQISEDDGEVAGPDAAEENAAEQLLATFEKMPEGILLPQVDLTSFDPLGRVEDESRREIVDPMSCAGAGEAGGEQTEEAFEDGHGLEALFGPAMPDDGGEEEEEEEEEGGDPGVGCLFRPVEAGAEKRSLSESTFASGDSSTSRSSLGRR